ncbi:50S ribosomal protein L3 [Mycoplasmatota bacterium]|nr:50S ribosomal protein L3 [Mycoplasmatota bacterium]
MAKGILGKKVGMTQIFNSEGKLVPVTVIDCNGNVVLQKKSVENDGYESVQVGYGEKSEKASNKPMMGHFEKSGSTPKRYLKELRTNEMSEFEVGQEVPVSIFADGDYVDVQGVSKGKGFQGSIKRHNQSRGPMSHGSHYHRRPGSMGPVAPNRVAKGKKLPGHMGSRTITIQNLQIVKVDADRGLLLIKGNVPGANKTFVTIKNAIKK